jgi:hypothetical protein
MNSLIVSPGMWNDGSYKQNQRLEIHINYTPDSRLSLNGELWYKGKCMRAGQIVECLQPDCIAQYETGWTPEVVTRLREIWQRWHLNDLRPACVHQRELGWTDKAITSITLYHWALNDSACKLMKQATDAAVNALKGGETFTPTPEQTFYANLGYSLTTHTSELPPELVEHYQPRRSLYAGDKGHTEQKTLGWLYPHEHPDGLLTRPCPICGYKYGTSWLKEDVPDDVIQWLFGLPVYI